MKTRKNIKSKKVALPANRIGLVLELLKLLKPITQEDYDYLNEIANYCIHQFSIRH